MTNRKKFEDIIWGLPVTSLFKLKVAKIVNQIYFALKGKYSENANIALLSCNEYYGHEYWLKKYSNYNHSIYGLIEHGLYFGNNSSIVGDERDYILNSIITFGDYRNEILKNAFPKHKIFMVGPRIAYAETDLNLLGKLKDEADGQKVLTLFPAHSLAQCKCEYDIDYLLLTAHEVMKREKITVLRVCLKEQDLVNGTSDLFREKGCQVVTAGSASINFLPRLRAIIESSSVAMSNSLGTNLGYCIYLNKPYYLIRQDRNNVEQNEDSEVHKTYKKEEDMFIGIFSTDKTAKITKEQYELCDYYWGFKYVKTPSELNAVFTFLNKQKNVK